jgi:hypothetical protein
MDSTLPVDPVIIEVLEYYHSLIHVPPPMGGNWTTGPGLALDHLDTPPTGPVEHRFADGCSFVWMPIPDQRAGRVWARWTPSLPQHVRACRFA